MLLFPFFPYIIRAANRKIFREIHQEIRAAQVQDVAKAWEVLKVIHWSWLLLSAVFRMMVWTGERFPQVWKKYRGTVGITAVGMFGKGGGWGTYTGRFCKVSSLFRRGEGGGAGWCGPLWSPAVPLPRLPRKKPTRVSGWGIPLPSG